MLKYLETYYPISETIQIKFPNIDVH